VARRKGWRAVKSRLSYTVDEAARNQGVAKGTVLRWLKSGLPYMKEQKPFLILGRDLVAFLKAKKAPKQTCKPDELYCFRCKAPRKPAFGAVEYRPKKPTGGRLTALCVECSTITNKIVSKAALEALKRILSVSFPQDHEALSEGVKPRSNDHLRKE
jgi:predicted transcriptional regulator